MDRSEEKGITTESRRSIEEAGLDAMNRVIAEHVDVVDAMYRDDVGGISFFWGEPGRGEKFKGGWGVSHLIARRSSEGQDGETIARKMVEVIAQGNIARLDETEKGSRVNIRGGGYTAILSLYKDGKRRTWLLTGWEDYKDNRKSPGETVPVYDGGGSMLSEATRFHSEEGAGDITDSITPGTARGNGEAPAAGLGTHFLK